MKEYAGSYTKGSLILRQNTAVEIDKLKGETLSTKHKEIKVYRESLCLDLEWIKVVNTSTPSVSPCCMAKGKQKLKFSVNIQDQWW